MKSKSTQIFIGVGFLIAAWFVAFAAMFVGRVNDIGGFRSRQILPEVTDPSFTDSLTVIGSPTSSLTLYLDKENPDPFDGSIVNFDAKNSAGTQKTYASMRGIVVDSTAGSEIGGVLYSAILNGSESPLFATFNDGTGVTVGSSAGALLFSSDSNGHISFSPNGTGLNTFTNTIALTQQQSVGSANEAIDTTSYTTIVTTDADGTTHTLADATATGTLKVIAIGTDGGGNATTTPTNFANGTSIMCDDAGDLIELYWTGSTWFRKNNEGCTINP